MTTRPPAPHLSIVSPVYGAPELIGELVRRIAQSVEPLGISYEIVLVNDACPRGSWAEICTVAAAHHEVVGINLGRNVGQHLAITAGLDHARGDWVVVMDCDLQDRPEEIPRLYQKALEGYDCVFGRRKERKDSALKTFPSVAFSWVYNLLSDDPVDPSVANFSVCSRAVIEAYRGYREQGRTYGMIIRHIGFRLAYIDVQHAQRPSGKSSYAWGSLVRFAVGVIVSGSNKPLRLSIKVGGIIALFSIGYGSVILVRHLVGGTAVAGWTTLAVMITFFNGLVMMQLGVLGLYLGRVFDESRRRPLYHVMERVGRDRLESGAIGQHSQR